MDQDQRPSSPSASPPASKIKFTSRVRRGLVLVAFLAKASLDDDAPPGKTLVGRWALSSRREYQHALDWIQQETAGPQAGGAS